MSVQTQQQRECNLSIATDSRRLMNLSNEIQNPFPYCMKTQISRQIDKGNRPKECIGNESRESNQKSVATVVVVKKAES